MAELLIIKTEKNEKLFKFLNKEKINYQVFCCTETLFSEQNQEFPTEDKLLQEYREAWQDPRRLAEAKQWEQAAMTDWAERAKKDKK